MSDEPHGPGPGDSGAGGDGGAGANESAWTGRDAPDGAAPGDRPEETDPPHRRPSEPGSGTPVACDLCGAPMLEVHCKLVCTRCGYQRDCSDP